MSPSVKAARSVPQGLAQLMGLRRARAFPLKLKELAGNVSRVFGAQETKRELGREINPFASTALLALTSSATNNGEGTIEKLGWSTGGFHALCPKARLSRE